jgi:hypothetical protein
MLWPANEAGDMVSSLLVLTEEGSTRPVSTQPRATPRAEAPLVAASAPGTGERAALTAEERPAATASKALDGPQL